MGILGVHQKLKYFGCVYTILIYKQCFNILTHNIRNVLQYNMLYALFVRISLNSDQLI